MKITLNPVQVQANRLVYSWQPEGPFKESSYWVEYPEIARIEASAGKLAESYLPVCLALACLGDVEIELPAKIDETVLANWHALAAQFGKITRKPVRVRFTNGAVDPGYKPLGNETALLLGGGTESLLTLAHLKEEGVKPLLASLGGGNWPGSDPALNPHKFNLDEELAHDLKLGLVKARTNFREAIWSEAWAKYFKPGNYSVINSVAALPSFLAMLMPVCEQLGIGRVVSGNERMSYPLDYLCFSPAATARLGGVARGLAFESRLEDYPKEDVCEELYLHHSDLVFYQYSCWKNRGERWCGRCPSCLQYFVLFRRFGVDPAAAGLDESKIWKHRRELIRKTADSPDGRRNEIWRRFKSIPEIRRQPAIKAIVDAVNRRAWLQHVLLARRGRWDYDAAIGRFRHDAKKLWLKIERRIDGVTWAVKNFFAARLFKAWIIEGTEPVSGEPLRILYAGIDRHKEYVSGLLESPSERYLGEFWNGGLSKLRKLAGPECAMAVYEVTGLQSKHFRLQSHFRVPLWAAVEMPLGDMRGIMGRKNYAEMQRRIRRGGLGFRLSRSIAVFRRFYSDMYRPTVQMAHGKSAYVKDYERVLEEYEQGEFFLVTREGQDVGGGVIVYDGETAHLTTMGLLDGAEELRRLGVSDAVYHYFIERAKERGCKKLNLGYSRAFLSDGVLRYKRSMGGELSGAYHRESGFLTFQFWRPTTALKNLLAQNPFVSIGPDGRFHQVAFCRRYEDVAAQTSESFEFYVLTDGEPFRVPVSKEYTVPTAVPKDPVQTARAVV